MTTHASGIETSEGAQEMAPRSALGPDELLRELGATLRLSEAEAAELTAGPDEDQTMIINMGPQHPSTHGVLRLMLELDGETVLRTKPVIGYLHTGMEKTGEDLTYLQGPTNVTRMDYAAPLFNELAFSVATETLLGIDGDIPPRAQWIRMLLCEINRMTSHLLFLATNGMDLGAVSMMIFGWREREEGLRVLEKITGLRMNHNFIRPGGVAADLPDGWRDDVLRFLDMIPPRLEEYDVLMTGQPIWRERLQGVGVITAEEAMALGATGPILRSAGVPWDLRRDMPYLFYDQVDFDVLVGEYGDCFDRYAIRLNEIRESARIVAQILELLPPGDYRIQDKKVTPPPRARIDESMEALIHHFKIFTEGFKVPEGEVYCAVESPRGELGCYIVSDGSAKPYRMHIRGPSFVNLQTLPHMMRGGLIADAVAVISSVDPIMGEVDPVSRAPASPVPMGLSPESRTNLRIAGEIISRYPRPKSALIPLLHLAQEQDGYVAEDAMEHIAELIGVTPAEVLGTCSFYEMFKREPVGTYLVNVCTNISCMLLGGEELLEHLEDRLGIRRGAPRPTGCSPSRTSSASPPAPRRRACR
jgi:NADH-quinone oxidoreductase subunit D